MLLHSHTEIGKLFHKKEAEYAFFFLYFCFWLGDIQISNGIFIVGNEMPICANTKCRSAAILKLIDLLQRCSIFKGIKSLI